MDYFLDNWGSFVGVLGVIISIGGFAIAIRQASRARTSAQAAEIASKQTREAIVRAMTVIDLERSIALIQRVKELHRDRRWDATIEHYQTLRVMLGDIRDRYPALTSALFTESRNPLAEISSIEDSVDRAIAEHAEPSGASNFNGVLNGIQLELENIARSIHQVGTR